MRIVAFFLLLCASGLRAQDSRSNGYPAPRSGIVLVDVDKTGRVTGAKMLQTTGDARLDALALNKFKQWHFRSGTAPHVKIPITFTPSGAKY